MFKYVVHVQYTQHTATCIERTEIQNILLNFTVILLYFYYNIASIIYLGNVHMIYMGPVYKHQGTVPGAMWVSASWFI